MEEKVLSQVKEENKTDTENVNQIQKTLLSQKTEDDYNLMINYLKKENQNNKIKEIVNYNSFSNDKFLGLESNNESDNENSEENDIIKIKIDDFLERDKNDIEIRQNNNKTKNDRIKFVDESTKKNFILMIKNHSKNTLTLFIKSKLITKIIINKIWLN